MPFLAIKEGTIIDKQHRTVVLRGINFAGDTKIPQKDGSYLDRPFSLAEAHEHLDRIRSCGFNTIRYLFTWDALEHEGPGIYDDEYIAFTIEMLKLIKAYGFLVFMDPHQDTWSFYSGGSGAPEWTFYCVGFDPNYFNETHAAILWRTPGAKQEKKLAHKLQKHNMHPGTKTKMKINYPINYTHGDVKMLWSSNYNRLVCQTMFTLFFAGAEFAPKCKLACKDEPNKFVNVGQYLVDCYMNAIAHFAKAVCNVDPELTLGWETLNEPAAGYIGIDDISQLSNELGNVKLGTCPSPLEGMLLGNMVECIVPIYEFSRMGCKKVGTTLIRPQHSVWLSADKAREYDAKYGWTRSWEVGCIWELHGVYNRHRLSELVKRTSSTTSLSSVASKASKRSLKDAKKELKKLYKDKVGDAPVEVQARVIPLAEQQANNENNVSAASSVGSLPDMSGHKFEDNNNRPRGPAPVILRPDYFAYDKTGHRLNSRSFVEKYFVDHFRRYEALIRSLHQPWWIFLQPPVNTTPPDFTDIDDTHTVFSPHHYDGLTLMTKKWTSFNVDAVGILRNQYVSPVFGVKIGEKAVRNSFCQQLAYLKKEGRKHVSENVPCLLSEIGIPFDMEGGYACAASTTTPLVLQDAMKEDEKEEEDDESGLDESSGLDNMSQNDLARLSADPNDNHQHEHHHHHHHHHKHNHYRSQTRAMDANCYALECNSLHHTLWVYTGCNTHNDGDCWNGEDLSIYSREDQPYYDGIRAARAVYRPTPRAVGGRIVKYYFDLQKCMFKLRVECLNEGGGLTEIFVPPLHFPANYTGVNTTAGSWRLGTGIAMDASRKDTSPHGVLGVAANNNDSHNTDVRHEHDNKHINSDPSLEVEQSASEHSPAKTNAKVNNNTLYWSHPQGTHTIVISGMLPRQEKEREHELMSGDQDSDSKCMIQ